MITLNTILSIEGSPVEHVSTDPTNQAGFEDYLAELLGRSEASFLPLEPAAEVEENGEQRTLRLVSLPESQRHEDSGDANVLFYGSPVLPEFVVDVKLTPDSTAQLSAARETVKGLPSNAATAPFQGSILPTAYHQSAVNEQATNTLAEVFDTDDLKSIFTGDLRTSQADDGRLAKIISLSQSSREHENKAFVSTTASGRGVAIEPLQFHVPEFADGASTPSVEKGKDALALSVRASLMTLPKGEALKSRVAELGHSVMSMEATPYPNGAIQINHLDSYQSFAHQTLNNLGSHQAILDKSVNLYHRDWPTQLGEIVLHQRSRGEHQATVQLDPPELGPMHIIVRQQGTETFVHVTARHPDTLHMLQLTAERLRDLIQAESSGFVHVDVSSHEHSRQETSSDIAINSVNSKHIDENQLNDDQERTVRIISMAQHGMIDYFA